MSEMNNEEKSKFFHIGLTIFLTACAIGIFIVALLHFNDVLSVLKKILKVATPIIDGLILTYLMAPVVNWLEQKWLYAHHSERIFRGKDGKTKEGAEKAKVKSRIRVLTIIMTYAFFILIVVALFNLIVPEIAKSIQSLATNYTTYLSNFENWAMSILQKYPDLEENFNYVMENYSGTINEWINDNVLGKTNAFLMGILSGGLSFVKAILNFIIGMIVAMYLLNSKELMIGQCKKVIYALMKKDIANAFIHNVRFTNKTFLDFFSGKIIDSVIIGILCFVTTSIIGTPYALLISVIVGVTNIIPFFGPFIGAIPSAFIVLLVDPKQCLYFIILILVLQQLDGNVIGPLILGQKTGLSSFWIIFAITFFGGLFSFAGMLVGVPVFAVIYTGFSAYVSARLESKGYSKDTKRYVHVDYIDDDDNFVRLPKEQVKKIMNWKDFKKAFGKSNSENDD